MKCQIFIPDIYPEILSYWIYFLCVIFSGRIRTVSGFIGLSTFIFSRENTKHLIFTSTGFLKSTVATRRGGGCVVGLKASKITRDDGICGNVTIVWFLACGRQNGGDRL